MLVHQCGFDFDIYLFLRIIGHVFEIVGIAPAPRGGAVSRRSAVEVPCPRGGEEILCRKYFEKNQADDFILFAKFGAIWNAKVVWD